jgi:formylglycine-generating enzyme required for sulfatase activity
VRRSNPLAPKGGGSGRGALLATLLLTACTTDLPPLGEALVVVDTDLPVPRLAGALRLDLYTADGSRWYESREVALPDPRDWPASFSIFAPDETERAALVRLRVYPRGKLRDYRGERWAPAPIGADPGTIFPTPDPTDGEGPRLMRDGVDVTPPSEPEPLLTVDRLFVLRFEEGVRGKVVVTMRGVCVGSQANLAERTSCLDTEQDLLSAVELAVDPDMTRPGATAAGSFGGEVPCTLSTGPDEVCVPGAGFVFGNADLLSEGHAPERVAVVKPFVIDVHEVTVARWRAGLARFSPPEGGPMANDGPFDPASTPGSPMQCTWTTTAGAREQLPLNCVTWADARAFCQAHGGDLPTEAQWELVAQVAGRPAKTRQTWGNDQVSCERAVYARYTGAPIGTGADWCVGSGAGVQPVGSPGGDVSLGLGVRDLEGNVSELVIDGYQPLDSACWLAAPLHDPVCGTPYMGLRVIRGASWFAAPWVVAGGFRFPILEAQIASGSGFRCVRSS